MNISFENPDKINGRMTIVVEETDYKSDVDKALKDYRRRANIPGFRPGQAPMSMIKRQFGTRVKMDTINKLLGENLQKYIVDNHIQMMGQPIPAENQKPVDLEGAAPYEFKFDIAIKPEFKIELNGKNKINYYEITVDDALIDQQVEIFQSRNGHYTTTETYDPEQRDILKGELHELDRNGNALEGGLTVPGVSMMPQYIKVEEQKKRFDGAKLGDIITFCPRAAYPDNDAEVASMLNIDKSELGKHTGNFSYQIMEISCFAKAENNKELWDSIYGADANIQDEADFRRKIAEGIKVQLESNSNYKFIQDVRTYCEDKVGKLTFPDAILKRIMLASNKDKGEKFVEENYAQTVKELTWQFIKHQLAQAHGIKVEDADIRETAMQTAREQFEQYGMSNVPEEYLKNYAAELLKKDGNFDSFAETALERKLSIALKEVVKLNKKEVSLEEFNKLLKTDKK